MRRIGVLLWLLRIVLPAVVAHWFGRAEQALLDRLCGSNRRYSGDSTLTAFVEIVCMMNTIMVLILILIIIVVLRWRLL